MAEILLVRHAKSYANFGDLAFGNVESPLNEEGIAQIEPLRTVFRETYGITPQNYDRPVLSSEFVRPQQTAQLTGFHKVDVSDIINESDFDRQALANIGPIRKHAREHWAPDETKDRASDFIELVRRGNLGYQIYFLHGLYIATVLLQLEREARVKGQDFPHEFNPVRGYIPRTATITTIEV